MHIQQRRKSVADRCLFISVVTRSMRIITFEIYILKSMYIMLF